MIFRATRVKGHVRDAVDHMSTAAGALDPHNAMTSDRAYRKAMPLQDAVAELRAGAGTKFDPDVVEALVAVIERT